MVLAAVVGIGFPTTAQAGALRATATHARINHPVIHSGSSASITGHASPNLHGQLVYLQRVYGGAWHTVTHYTLNSTSHFTFVVKPAVGGRYVYRVYHHSVGVWGASVSPNLGLTVQTRYMATLLKHGPHTGSWQGPTERIPTADYTINYNYSCTDSYSNYLSISWNGNSGGFEYLWNDPADGHSGSGTWYGHQGLQYGYLDIGTQEDCTWAFNVTYMAWH